MYFENAGHLGGDAENDIPKIQRISVTPPKFPMYSGDVILSIPAQMSLFEFQGTVVASTFPKINVFSATINVGQICLRQESCTTQIDYWQR